ncbi:hypothetical protein TNCV_1514691 [Trichonephila clavipes]|nr:hypothetical protein TNCV_1514691 [Trichonephila clavipes]
MPPSRMRKLTFVMPRIKVLSIHGIEDCLTVQTPKGKRLFCKIETRFGHGTANTIYIAIIRNFYYPFDIFITSDLSSDHSPVFLNFKLKTPIHSKNPGNTLLDNC